MYEENSRSLGEEENRMEGPRKGPTCPTAAWPSRRQAGRDTWQRAQQCPLHQRTGNPGRVATDGRETPGGLSLRRRSRPLAAFNAEGPIGPGQSYTTRAACGSHRGPTTGLGQPPSTADHGGVQHSSKTNATVRGIRSE